MLVVSGKPSEIEMLLRMRLFDGKSDEPKSELASMVTDDFWEVAPHHWVEACGG